MCPKALLILCPGELAYAVEILQALWFLLDSWCKVSLKLCGNKGNKDKIYFLYFLCDCYQNPGTLVSTFLQFAFLIIDSGQKFWAVLVSISWLGRCIAHHSRSFVFWEQNQAAILSHLSAYKNLQFVIQTRSFVMLVLLWLDSYEVSCVQDKSKTPKIHVQVN